MKRKHKPIKLEPTKPRNHLVAAVMTRRGGGQHINKKRVAKNTHVD